MDAGSTMHWGKRRVIVTGGAGFIGAALVDRLLESGAYVTIVDKLLRPNSSDLWRAKVERVSEVYRKHGLAEANLELIDLSTERERFQILAGKHDVVFHLSAVFGGREFVDMHQTECSEMFAIDHNVFRASLDGGIERLHYASSACVYPPSLNIPRRPLKEDDTLSVGDGWRSSDNLYGFAKLMGEMQLNAYHSEKGFKSSICRYLTVYGPGELDDSHSIASLTEKAIRKMDPYVVWGTGDQERGFTYVDDIVNGTILACEKVTDATPINLGWDKTIKIREVAGMILRLSGHKPERILFDRSKPEGPFSRSLEIARAKRLLEWEPKVDLEQGLRPTIEWHRQIRKGSDMKVQSVQSVQ